MPFRFNPFTDKLDLVETGGSGGGITTINGDSGSITGTTVTIYSNNAAVNSGASVKFVNSGTISSFNVTDSVDSTYIGKSSGNLTNTSAGSNTALGRFTLNALTTGFSETAVGARSLVSCTSSPDNCGFGAGSLFSLTTGTGFNTSLGTTSLNQLATGANNVAVGAFAGDLYVGAESNNIMILNEGVPGESNTTRIGTQGSGTRQQNRCFVAGITGASPTGANAPQVVLCDNAGQLTPITSDTAGFVLTSNGAGTTPTFQAAGGGGSTVQFQAYLTSPQTVAGGSTSDTIVFNTAIANVGSAYNTGTGVFTAPSNGFYAFSANIFYKNLNVPVGLTSIILGYTGSVQSLRLVQQSIAAAAGGDVLIISASWSMPMTAGDTVQMQPFADGTGNYQIYGSALASAAFNTSSTFSGYKIA